MNFFKFPAIVLLNASTLENQPKPGWLEYAVADA